jgi:4-amino-4-deoxy-L-arabinose transferase-like glycosyltransferase
MATAAPDAPPVSAPAPVAGLRPSARVAAAALILAVAAANVLYLVLACPVELSPDEAHYWDWSRRPPEWCYYSKGPLVAWLIRGSCELFGPSMPAVRLPAVACNALLLAAVFRLTARAFRSDRLALAAVALALTVPAVAAPAVLMTIDAPYLCCWGWACAFAQRAATGGQRWNWPAAGAVCAVGLLAKYTMALFPVCVGLFLVAHRREELRRVGYWTFCGTAALGAVPILLWNAGHDWVGVRHVATQAGGRPGADPTAFPFFLVGQFALLTGYWFVAWVAAVVRFRPGRSADPRTAFLWWASVPVWGLFAVAALKTRGQPNWPAAAYVPGLVLAVGWVARQVTDPSPGYRRTAVGFLAAAVILGLTVTTVARFPGTVRPVLADLAGPPTERHPVPVRKLDPTCRLAGWRQLAAKVDEVRAQVRAEEGREPVLAGMVWTTPGELAFYCDGRPEVYTFGLALADRHSQYDVWRPNPVADAQAFRGRTFVYVGDPIPDAHRVFDRVDPPVEVSASDGGTPVADWQVWVLRGFRGFPAGPAGRRGAGY